MRTMLNLSAVLMCAALAGLSALTQSAPSRAASALTAPSSAVAFHGQILPVAHRANGSVEAHFAAANTTHDGRLTRDQVEHADWPRVSRHFDEIDTDHRGWITADQIHAFNKTRKKHR